MRQSGAHAGMMQLRPLVEGVSLGSMALPDFQRDFDWSESDVRALLVTVFSGWPAGSLLLLDARKPVYKLREFEAGPPIRHDPSYAVLDGQQRLTSLFHALYGTGPNRYAVRWDEPNADMEDLVVSYKERTWNARYHTLRRIADAHLIPVSVLKTPSTFFQWRDEVVSTMGPEAANAAKQAITDLYTSRLSRIHEYEFPAVTLDSDLDPTAIARIFERVNRTGLRLNAFDLMVAKTYSTNWNLRDQWTASRTRHPELSIFLEDDGMPLLQAIALLEKSDLRQSAVLNLSRQQVQSGWERAAASCASVIEFLRTDCGTLRRDYMPYPNALPLLITLAMQDELAPKRGLLREWYWYIGFAGALDAAANTRLVSHYKSLLKGEAPRANPDRKRVDFGGVNRKTDRAFWSSAVGALATQIRTNSPDSLSDFVVDDLDVATLFSQEQIGDLTPESPYRSVLNAVIYPRKHMPVAARLDSDDTLAFAKANGFGSLVESQVGNAPNILADWENFSTMRREWLAEFIRANALHGDLLMSDPDEPEA